MEVLKIDDSTLIFNEGNVKFFLLIGENKALMIDSGMMTKNALDLARPYTDKPIELINTHVDMDHIGSNEQFECVMMHEDEVQNYKLMNKVITVKDNDCLDLGNRLIKVIHTPGHTPGSIALLDVNNRNLFTGDPIQKNGVIFMFGPSRNLSLYGPSLQKVYDAKGYDNIYPSHGECPLSKDVLKGLMDALPNVLDNRANYSDMEMHGHMIKRVYCGPSDLLLPKYPL